MNLTEYLSTIEAGDAALDAYEAFTEAVTSEVLANLDALNAKNDPMTLDEWVVEFAGTEDDFVDALFDGDEPTIHEVRQALRTYL